MQWTDQIRRIKIILVVAAILIAVASLVVSHALTTDLESQERTRMEVWAEAMRTLNNADENTDLNLVLKVLNENNTIPVVVMDKNGQVSEFRNIKLKAETYADSLQAAATLGRSFLASGNVIRITLDRKRHEYIDVCYGESVMLQRLAWYPFIQLGVVLIFVVVAIFALLSSKRAEQNKVWVGLSKETAHQLGTPISSLMAWVEMLKEQYPDDELIPELDKDVQRLQLISDRFSKIGSLPELKPTSLTEVIDHVTDYMDHRTSRKVIIARHLPDHDVVVNMNASLFEWVIENLCKNAVDAMGGVSGRIDITVEELPGKVAVEVADTGKGIKKKNVSNVFRPGFTTKKRGWGLGLSLAKRIIEEYHKGRIWVKSTEVGKGTTFRIEIGKGRQG